MHAPPVNRPFTGGENPERLSPPSAAASPEFDHPPPFLLRRTFAPRSWQFLPVRVLLPENNTQKDHHIRPLRLRRTTAVHHTSSSGQHSLAGVQRKQTPATPVRTLLSELRGLYDQMILLFLFHLIHAAILILLPAAAWARIVAADLHFFLKRDPIRGARAIRFFR